MKRRTILAARVLSLSVMLIAGDPVAAQHAPSTYPADAFSEQAIPATVCHLLNTREFEHPRALRFMRWLHLHLPPSRYTRSLAVFKGVIALIRRLENERFLREDLAIRTSWREAREKLYDLGPDAVPYLVGAAAARSTTAPEATRT